MISLIATLQDQTRKYLYHLQVTKQAQYTIRLQTLSYFVAISTEETDFLTLEFLSNILCPFMCNE